jgi:hypothetical protein
MRRSLLVLSILLCLTVQARGEELECPFPMAEIDLTFDSSRPGLDYAVFDAPKPRRSSPGYRVHIVRADLSSPLTLRVLRLREEDMRVEKLVKTVGKAGTKVLAAINGDYFSAFQEGKHPHGLHVSGGQMYRGPSGTTSLALAANGKVQMAAPTLTAEARINGTTLPIDVLHRRTPKKGVGLHFGAFAQTVEPQYKCRAVVFATRSQSYVNLTVDAKVVRTLPKVKRLSLAADEGALVLCGPLPETLPAVGETIALTLGLKGLNGAIVEAISGGPRILRQGKRVFEGKAEGFPLWQRGYLSGTHPRTALGLSADSKTLYLLVAEGRPGGLDGNGAACVLQGLGATDAMLLDGGGSSVMIWQGRIVNRPHLEGQRTSRRVANALAIIPTPAKPDSRAK